MNAVEDCSISRIVRWLVQHLEQRAYCWHIGGLRGVGGVGEEFRRLGAKVVDLSELHDGSGNLATRIRDYVAANRIKVVHTHTPLTILTAARALAGTTGTVHVSTEHNLYAPRDHRFGLLYALLGRGALYLPDHLVPVSRRMCGQILAQPGITASRVTAIQNAIDANACYAPDQREACRLEFGLAPESPVLGYTGRLEGLKRLDLLLASFPPVLARHPQARLMIVGEGGARPRLETLSVTLGISHAVIWTGFHRDISRLLAAMDVFVHPSANEGLSLSILEAMAAGKPVIATKVGGAEEVITNQQTGVVIPPGSSSAIAAAVLDLLDHPEKRSTLARAARDRVLREFDVERMTDAYRCVYDNLVSEHRNGNRAPARNVARARRPA